MGRLEMETEGYEFFCSADRFKALIFTDFQGFNCRENWHLEGFSTGECVKPFLKNLFQSSDLPMGLHHLHEDAKTKHQRRCPFGLVPLWYYWETEKITLHYYSA